MNPGDADEARAALHAVARSGGERVAWAHAHGVDARSLNACVSGRPSDANQGTRTFDLAIDDGNVYFTAFEGLTGAVYKVAKSGGQATRISGDLAEPHGIVVDDTHVYWTSTMRTGHGGSVFRALK